MITQRFIRFNTLLISLFALSGCKMALLDPKGLIAADEKDLLITAVLLMLIIVVPVIVLTWVFAWKYREGNSTAKYSPDWHHSTLIEIICWSVPCLIITILAIITWTSSHQLDPYRPLNNKEKPLIIQAIALNWKWLFIYPEQKIATVNYLMLPIHVPIRFLITADAPMNSFQIPQLGSQIYAMAGMETKLNLIANEKGHYQGASTNFSGVGFSDMKFPVKVTSQEKFNDWITRHQQSTNLLTSATYQNLAAPSENNPVQYFSLIDQKIFTIVMMNYMMPMSNGQTMADTQKKDSVQKIVISNQSDLRSTH